MKFREPKNTDRIEWTEHVKGKMKTYVLSENRLRRLLRNPDRIEEGVALKTTAIMQSTKSKNPTEIWLMYKMVKGPKKIKVGNKEIKSKHNQRIRIISAWRYPGKSPEGSPPIPNDTIKELDL